MSKIELTVRYSGIEFVSDRTARETLKRLSKIVRRAQILETSYILRQQKQMSLATFQSLESRSAFYLASAPLMEIESAQKGSWQVVAALGAFGIWALSATVGESLTDGWKKTEFHEFIVHYIENIRPAKFSEFLDESLETEDFEGRFKLAGHIEIQYKKKKTRYIINLVPNQDVKIESRVLIDGDYVVRELTRQIRRDN